MVKIAVPSVVPYGYSSRIPLVNSYVKISHLGHRVVLSQSLFLEQPLWVGLLAGLGQLE